MGNLVTKYVIDPEYNLKTVEGYISENCRFLRDKYGIVRIYYETVEAGNLALSQILKEELKYLQKHLTETQITLEKLQTKLAAL